MVLIEVRRLEPIDRDGVGVAFHGESEEFIIAFDHRERTLIQRLQRLAPSQRTKTKTWVTVANPSST